MGRKAREGLYVFLSVVGPLILGHGVYHSVSLMFSLLCMQALLPARLQRRSFIESVPQSADSQQPVCSF